MNLINYLVNFIFLLFYVNCYDVDDGLLKELHNRIASYQVLKDQPYEPLLKWEEKKGLFRSDIRLNLFGNQLAQEARNGEISSVYDNDMFSTGWILATLFDSIQYGRNVPSLDSDRLQLALESIGSFRDKNVKSQTTLSRTFWPQVYNSTDEVWQQKPDNIMYIALNIENFPWLSIEKLLHLLKFDNMIKYVEELRRLGTEAVKVFCIPPDFDDTYLNLGLGGSLFKLRSIYPRAYKSWLINNTDIDDLIQRTIKYSYKPFSSNPNENTIDPRTFYYARGFIQQAEKENKSISLVSTWMQNIEEQRKLKYKSVSIPFNVNNVDVTVSANTIYGITSAAIYDINDFTRKFSESKEMIQLYLNTSSFISWAIKNNFTSRPDLAQVYYPSTYNFLWYASRTLFLIENEVSKFEYLNKNGQTENYFENFKKIEVVLLEAKSYLQDAFETKATEFLLHEQVIAGVNMTYFRDFLGLNDTNICGKQEPKNDDAIFSTAQAINILISTWTYQRPDTKGLKWKTRTPDRVKRLVISSVNWLHKNIFNNKLKTLNAFFSGSVKGFTSLPFWYPANFVQFFNGTQIDPDEASVYDLGDAIYGVKGSINEFEYQRMLKQKHFGQTTPIDFVGYNVKENTFPFWSSTPYTYAVSLLALTQFNNLE